MSSQARPSSQLKRLVWIIHCLLYEPQKLSSPFHIATCGRFYAGPYQGKGKVKPKRNPKRVKVAH